MSLPDWMQKALMGGQVVIQPNTLYMPSGAVLSGTHGHFESGICADISGEFGAFTSSLTVQGKVVIKDGDPVAVASGEVHIISGVIAIVSGGTIQISGAVSTSVSGNAVLATSGTTLPVSLVSGLWAPSKTTISGGAIITVASGGAIFYGVIAVFISGLQPTFSGQQYIVNDATSGMAGINSGTTLYYYNFGPQSGATRDGPWPATDAIVYCSSGIVAQSASGLKLTVFWAKV